MKIGVLIIIKKSQIARFTTNIFEGVLNDLALEKNETRFNLRTFMNYSDINNIARVFQQRHSSNKLFKRDEELFASLQNYVSFRFNVMLLKTLNSGKQWSNDKNDFRNFFYLRPLKFPFGLTPFILF